MIPEVHNNGKLILGNASMVILFTIYIQKPIQNIIPVDSAAPIIVKVSLMIIEQFLRKEVAPT